MSKPALLSQREEGAGGAHTLGGLSETPVAAIPAHILESPALLGSPCDAVSKTRVLFLGSWGQKVGKELLLSENSCKRGEVRFRLPFPARWRWSLSAWSFLLCFRSYNLWTPVFTETTQWLFAFPTPLVNSIFFFFFGSVESEESTSILFNFPRLEINQKLT